MHMGQVTLPQSSYKASKMQQRLGSLYVSDIVEANSMIWELQNLCPTILFPAVDDIENISIVSFSLSRTHRMQA